MRKKRRTDEKVPKSSKKPKFKTKTGQKKMEVLETAIGVILCIGAGAFAYVSSHMVEEKRQGKRIAFPWEKE